MAPKFAMTRRQRAAMIAVIVLLVIVVAAGLAVEHALDKKARDCDAVDARMLEELRADIENAAIDTTVTRTKAKKRDRAVKTKIPADSITVQYFDD